MSQNRVLPLPEPPTTSTFLFLAFAGFFGRLPIISRSVRVRITLFANTGSSNGSMSFCVPQRAEPYSMPWRYFLAFLPFRYTASRKPAPQHTPISKSIGCRLGIGLEKAAPRAERKPRSFSDMSAPSAILHASPRLVHTRPAMKYGRFRSSCFFVLLLIDHAPDFCGEPYPEELQQPAL